MSLTYEVILVDCDGHPVRLCFDLGFGSGESLSGGGGGAFFGIGPGARNQGLP